MFSHSFSATFSASFSQVRTTCLKAIFDLLLFDPRLASLRPKNLQGIDEEEDGAEAGAGEKPMTVAEALVPALEDDDSEIATAAGEGYVASHCTEMTEMTEMTEWVEALHKVR